MKIWANASGRQPRPAQVVVRSVGDPKSWSGVWETLKGRYRSEIMSVMGSVSAVAPGNFICFMNPLALSLHRAELPPVEWSSRNG